MKRPKAPKDARRQRVDGTAAVELCEEATHLLRSASSAVWVLYYAGSVPFWLGFLFFWADMSRDPFAASRSATASLGVAVLFLWMKCLHALAMNRLRADISGVEPEPVTTRSFGRVAAAQCFVHGVSLIALPLAALIVLPLGFVVAYFQNATALGAYGGVATLKELTRRAAKQSALWPGQNHRILSIISAFALVVALNLLAALIGVPHLVKALTGVESVFTRSGWSVFNTTLLLVILALTHLCVDPLLKTVYLLRCFYGESLSSGEDLRVELAAVDGSARRRVRAAVLGSALLALCFSCPASGAAQASPPAVSRSVSAGHLDQALSDVIQRREFRWRMPREVAAEPTEEMGWLGRFLHDSETMVKDAYRYVKRAIDRGIEWLGKKFFNKAASAGKIGGSSVNWGGAMQVVGSLLIGVVAAALALWAQRAWKGRRSPTRDAVAASPFVIPDVSQEDVTADQLPEDGWIALARELAEKGDLRLAMRALYLACLAALARRGAVSIARFKSNLDYKRELQRRHHSRPELTSAFSQNVDMFDRSWYGLHEVTPEAMERFSANLQAIRADAPSA